VARRKPTSYFEAALARVHSQHPRFVDAVVADAKLTSHLRGISAPFDGPVDTLVGVLRLMWVTDAFACQVLYRAKARHQALGVPVIPMLLHRLSIMIADVYIGETVLVHPGLFIGHGIVVIDGFVEIHPGVAIMPGVTIGLRDQAKGPTIERDVQIGTGAKVLGNLTVGRGARIGANAVVIDDVAPGATVVGVPARPVRRDDASG
jgi:serine O-acetyltransferase